MPFTAMPAKSRPGVRGSVVFLKRPATFPMSLGLMAAAFTRTSASPSPGSGIGTSSIRNTDGGPNSVKRNDFITLVLIYTSSDIRAVQSKTAGRGIQNDRHSAFAELPWPKIELSQAAPDQRLSLHERIGILDRFGLQD